MEERENKYLKNKNFNFRLGVYIITILIFLGVATFKISSSIREFNERFKVSEEFLGETVSSDGKYKIEAYLINGGATVDWSVKCYLREGESKKEIYRDYHINEANMIWIDNDTISINNHNIDLPNGKYDFRDE
ncbi:TPA: DUF5412 family protein [Clostridium perfringens]|uniref:DUF5412 domain-containing protein n=1 Tax=Clostridium perfringens (strain ATCC 13124 / DSM 756 / JCM 1290 / NCIMB 6125 / NCTC 8237 / Type A) TaxID=195103 RepID=A0A0H2YSE6_CLOP1|nr:DUF5412 family protein [Clostridium perfringens]ABG83388.1 conserved hypothetical protein [Clostridium perfringens ATCC 13124]EGT0697001.1 DUF5412 domain-containing protein [Clostridium perfringens]EGT3603934.1 hypothetical protein [Clostridium perfringens]EHA6439955.1 DUF5412 domain-containing protein [Clostridium perfringens]EHK2425996.1 hypothetical protein [Clostridium perfringens]